MKQVLHLVRAGGRLGVPPSAADWLVELDGEQAHLRAHGAPPQPAGPLSPRELLELIRAAHLVVTW